MNLQRPIKDVLVRKLDDARLEAVWRGVRERRQPRRRTRTLGLAAASLAVVAGGLLLWLQLGRPAVAPLQLADATPVGALAATQQPRTIDFDDGSHVTLSPGGLLEPDANRDRVFGTTLVRGRAAFEVRPGGPRRWLVHAGSVTVEVVGTHFVVDRAARSVAVSVTRGKVLVRGDGIAGGVRQLTVGQSLRVQDTAPHEKPAAGEQPTAPLDDVVPSEEAPAAPESLPAAYRRLATQRIAGVDPHLPDAVKRQLRGQPEHSFSAQICVNSDGSVSDVSVLQGIAGADDSLVSTLKQWRYAPQPIPVCFVTQLIFSVE